MVVDADGIRAEPHVTVGALIQRDAGIVIERWSRRAIEEQPHAKRLHHEALLDHLPRLLRNLGRSLAEADAARATRHRRPARRHGQQRWQEGWSLAEVVRDYQILRLVLVEYLEEALGRSLRSREAMAVGLALDEAIAASVNAYVAANEQRNRQADEALRQQAEQLREADRRKDEFLAFLAHELRNPLAPLQNALQVLGLQGVEPATLAWARDLMGRQVQHLTRLVDDLLDVSRISQGKISLHREQLDVVKLVREVVEDRRSLIATAGLRLVLDLPREPVWVDGDSTRLAQVVGNLLQNAVKFTDPGGQISIRITVETEKQRVALVVSDTGIGIEPAFLPRVFETFLQADRSVARSRGGLGLGLALVKGLVQLHGGEVRAASEGIGRGTEMTVWLPLTAHPVPQTPPAPPSPPSVPLRILIIEDEPDCADSMRMLLELSGNKVRVAHTGPEGVEAAHRETLDVVLCDLGLPGLDGYAVAAALRQDPATATIPLIALSGYGSDADRKRCQEAGFTHHLVKPVAPEVLQQLLQSLRTAGPSSAPGS